MNLEKIPDYKLTPAEINKEILNYPFDPINATEKLISFIESVQ